MSDQDDSLYLLTPPPTPPVTPGIREPSPGLPSPLDGRWTPDVLPRILQGRRNDPLVFNFDPSHVGTAEPERIYNMQIPPPCNWNVDTSNLHERRVPRSTLSNAPRVFNEAVFDEAFAAFHEERNEERRAIFEGRSRNMFMGDDAVVPDIVMEPISPIPSLSSGSSRSGNRAMFGSSSSSSPLFSDNASLPTSGYSSSCSKQTSASASTSTSGSASTSNNAPSRPFSAFSSSSRSPFGQASTSQGFGSSSSKKNSSPVASTSSSSMFGGRSNSNSKNPSPTGTSSSSMFGSRSNSNSKNPSPTGSNSNSPFDFSMRGNNIDNPKAFYDDYNSKGKGSGSGSGGSWMT